MHDQHKSRGQGRSGNRRSGCARRIGQDLRSENTIGNTCFAMLPMVRGNEQSIADGRRGDDSRSKLASSEHQVLRDPTLHLPCEGEARPRTGHTLRLMRTPAAHALYPSWDSLLRSFHNDSGMHVFSTCLHVSGDGPSAARQWTVQVKPRQRRDPIHRLQCFTRIASTTMYRTTIFEEVPVRALV